MQRAYCDGVCVAFKPTTGSRITYRASVASNELLVCVPRGMRTDSVTEFVVSTVRDKRRAEVFNDYRDGGFLYLFGEKKNVRTYPSEEKRPRVSMLEEDVFIGLPAGATSAAVDYAVRLFYEKELTKKLKQRVPLMQTYVGLNCASWKVSSYHAAWGKCVNSEKTITFSVDLATQTQRFIDVVIIHELGHIMHADHGAAFQKYMTRFAPDHRAVLRAARK